MGFRNWGVSTKLIFTMVALGVITATAVGLIAGESSYRTISDSMAEHYASIRDIRTQQIQDYFSDHVADIQMFADSDDIALMYKRLLQYHIDMKVGENDEFPVDTAEYKQLWATGTRIEHFLNAYGYYDVFLICRAHGHVMYTVAKEDDLGANLRSGSLQTTHLAECWRQVCETESLYLTDTKAYEPSNGAAAQFVGFPVHIDGEFEAVLVFQLPQHLIDEIVTSAAGMGETGETYLVGSDHLMRSNSRLIKQETGEESVLSKECNQAYIDKCLAGETQVDMNSLDYEGVSCITAYGFVDLPSDIRWAVVSEIYASEAYGPIHRMVLWIIAAVIAFAVIAAFIAFLTGRMIGIPLQKAAVAASRMADRDFAFELEATSSKDEIGQMMQAFSTMKANTQAWVEQVTRLSAVTETMSSGDFTVDVPQHDAADEIGLMTNSLSSMKDNLRALIEQVASAAANVAASSEELAASSDEAAKAVQSVAQITASNTETVESISKDIVDVAAYAQQAASQGTEGKQSADHAADIINRAADSVQATTKTVHSLGAKTERITEFISIITGIADQTNLLALNAAIEAARAGEAGRGFAVVAEEVRKLAEESSAAAGNITELIRGIENEMKAALSAMEQSDKQVTDGAQIVSEAGALLAEIVKGVQVVSEKVQSISAAAEESAAAAEEISSANEEQTATMEEIGASANDMAQLAQDLQNRVSKFKVSENA